MKLSFVIPCYRSEKTLAGVVQEIDETVQKLSDVEAHEIICVNDCSPDGTWGVIKQLSAAKPHVKGLNFAKNRGKHMALMAGFRHAKGDIVVISDDDNQTPVDKLPELLKPLLEDGYDVAVAQYPKKKSGLIKTWGRKVNDHFMRRLLGRPKGLVFSNFIARRRFVCDAMCEYQSPFVSLEALTLQVTQRIAGVPMEERSRKVGKSGFNLFKSADLFMSGLVGFSIKPLRLISFLGLGFGFIAFILLIIGLIGLIAGAAFASSLYFFFAAVLLLNGVTLACLGLMSEYIGRTLLGVSHSPQYVICEKTNLED